MLASFLLLCQETWEKSTVLDEKIFLFLLQIVAVNLTWRIIAYTVCWEAKDSVFLQQFEIILSHYVETWESVFLCQMGRMSSQRL